jgi:FAD synthase
MKSRRLEELKKQVERDTLRAREILGAEKRLR